MTSPLAAGTARQILLMIILVTILFNSSVLADLIERKAKPKNSTDRPPPKPREIYLLKAMHKRGTRPYVRISLNSTIANSTFINIDIQDCGGKAMEIASVQWQLGQQSLDMDKNGLRKCETWIPKAYVAKYNTFSLGISDVNSTQGLHANSGDGTYDTRIAYLDPFFRPNNELFRFRCTGGPAKMNKQKYVATGCLIQARSDLNSPSCLRVYDYKWDNGAQAGNSTDPNSKYGPNRRGRLAGASCSRNDPLQLWAIEDVSHEFTADNHKMSGDIKDLPAPPVRYDLTPGQN